jgi:hypothetical protein
MNRNQIPPSKRELALAMIRAGKTYREVATALDIGTGSVHRIIKAAGITPMELAREIRREFAAKCLIVADYIVESISDIKITNATMRENALAAAIFADKAFQHWPDEGENGQGERNIMEQEMAEITLENREVEPEGRNA